MPTQHSGNPRIKLLAIAAFAASVFSCSLSAVANPVELSQAQRTLLELQLKDAYKCTFSEMLFMRELEIGGKKSIEGRIRCADQREVDFTQASPNERFELRLCQPTVC